MQSLELMEISGLFQEKIQDGFLWERQNLLLYKITQLEEAGPIWGTYPSMGSETEAAKLGQG